MVDDKKIKFSEYLRKTVMYFFFFVPLLRTKILSFSYLDQR